MRRSSSAVGERALSPAELVDKATNHLLLDETFDVLSNSKTALMIELANLLNTNLGNPNLGTQVSRALRRRLRHTRPDVVLLSLSLLDHLMEECFTFHVHIATQKFMNNLEKLLKKKNQSRRLFRRASSAETLQKQNEVEKRTLGLIQSWAKTFSADQYPIFSQEYQSLQQQGYTFPPPKQEDHIFSQPEPPQETEEAKMPFVILDNVRHNVIILQEMLVAVDYEAKEGGPSEALTQLRQQIETVSNKLQELVNNAEQTAVDKSNIRELLLINEKLLEVQQSYEDIVEARQKQRMNQPPPAAKPSPVEQTTQSTQPEVSTADALPTVSETAATADNQQDSAAENGRVSEPPLSPSKEDEYSDDEEEEEGHTHAVLLQQAPAAGDGQVKRLINMFQQLAEEIKASAERDRRRTSQIAQ